LNFSKIHFIGLLLPEVEELLDRQVVAKMSMSAEEQEAIEAAYSSKFCVQEFALCFKCPGTVVLRKDHPFLPSTCHICSTKFSDAEHYWTKQKTEALSRCQQEMREAKAKKDEKSHEKSHKGNTSYSPFQVKVTESVQTLFSKYVLHHWEADESSEFFTDEMCDEVGHDYEDWKHAYNAIYVAMEEDKDKRKSFNSIIRKASDESILLASTLYRATQGEDITSDA
jgi:hypothetical protein